MIHPLVLGVGRRLFPEGAHASLRLTDSVTTSTGAVITTYQRARDCLDFSTDKMLWSPARSAPDPLDAN
jgi:hypothetical protein